MVIDPASDATEDNEWEGYETGPFCRHRTCAHDCERTCARCGALCTEHPYKGESDHDWEDRPEET